MSANFGRRGTKGAAFTFLVMAGLSGWTVCYGQESSVVQPLNSSAPVPAASGGEESSGGIRFWKKKEDPYQISPSADGMSLSRELPAFVPEDPRAGMPQTSGPAGASGKPLQHFVPTGAPPQAPAPRPTRQKAVAPAPVVEMAGEEDETAFNPKFGVPQFDVPVEQPVVTTGGLTTASGSSLQQYVAPPSSGREKKPEVKAVTPQKVAPIEAPVVAVEDGLSPEQRELYSRLPMPSFIPEEAPQPSSSSGPMDAGGSALTQFVPTGPPPAPKQPAPARVRKTQASVDEVVAVQTEGSEFYEARSAFPMPVFDVASQQAAAQAQAGSGGPMTSSGSALKQFQPDPQATAKAASRRGTQKSVTPSQEDLATAQKAELEAQLKKSEDFYQAESRFAMPTLDPESAAQAVTAPSYGGPATASGNALQQFTPVPAGKRSR